MSSSAHSLAFLLGFALLACAETVPQQVESSTADVGSILDSGVIDVPDIEPSFLDVAVVDSSLDGGMPEPDQGDLNPAVGVTFMEVEGPRGRSLPAAIWYPAPPGTVGQPFVYKGIFSRLGVEDAPFQAGGPYPLVLFSHGNASAKEQSVFLTEELARNGYIVMAVDHTGNSFFDDSQPLLPIMNQLRPDDLSAAIDRLSAPESGDPAWLATQIDFGRIAATGHSRGGYTALALAGAALTPSTAYRVYCASNPDEATCRRFPSDAAFHTFRDERVSAAILFSPAKYTLTAEGIAQTQTPVLIMTGMLDAITRYGMEVRPIYDALLTDKYLWTIENGDHFTFSDLCEAYEVLPPERQLLFGVACDEDNPLPLAEAHALIRPVVQTFLDVYLRDLGDVEGVLEPTEGAEVRMEVTLGD